MFPTLLFLFPIDLLIHAFLRLGIGVHGIAAWVRRDAMGTTYVWFSPLGDRNHAPMHMATTMTAPMKMLYLYVESRDVSSGIPTFLTDGLSPMRHCLLAMMERG